MAVDPQVFDCPVDTWVKIATSVIAGAIHRLSSRPHSYLQTIRVTANPAPTDNSDAALIFDESTQAFISSDSAVDIYIKAVGVAGKVRADL